MASDKLIFQIIVEGKNVKVVKKDTDALGKSVERTNAARDKGTKAGSRYNKQEKAIYQSTLSSAKGFSKMNQTMSGSSGLVGAYATLAANVFAATAAFGALRSAAQVEQLAAGLEEVGLAGGRNLKGISENLREITGLAISTEDAMRSVAIGISAGFSTDQMEELTRVAKGASLALGRDMGDAMNRLIRGAAKLEPEILDELGIMVRLDQATTDYAASIGKSVTQLTQYERRMAFINAINQEGLEKFGSIAAAIDANPYDKLSASLADLVKVGTNLINLVLSPLVNVFSGSLVTMAGGVIIFASTIAKQMIPALFGAAGAAAASSKAAAEMATANLLALKTTGSFPAAYNKYISSVKDGSATIKQSTTLQKGLTSSIASHERHIAKWAQEKAGTRAEGDKEQIGIHDEESLKKKKHMLREARDQQTLLTASTEANIISERESGKAMAFTNAKIGTLKLGWAQLTIVNRANTQAILENVKAHGWWRGALAKSGAAATAFALKAKFVGTAIMSSIPVIGQVVMVLGLVYQAYKKWFDKTPAWVEAMEKTSEATETIIATQDKLELSLSTVDDQTKRTAMTWHAYAGAVQTAVDAIISIITARRQETAALIVEFAERGMAARRFMKEYEEMGMVAQFFSRRTGAWPFLDQFTNLFIPNIGDAIALSKDFEAEIQNIKDTADKIEPKSDFGQALIRTAETQMEALKSFGDISEIELAGFQKIITALGDDKVDSLVDIIAQFQQVAASATEVSMALTNAAASNALFVKEQNKLAQKTATPFDNAIKALEGMESQYEAIEKRVKETRSVSGEAAALELENELIAALNEKLGIEKVGKAESKVAFTEYVARVTLARDRIVQLGGEIKLLEVQHKKLAKAAKTVPEALQLQLDLEEKIRLKKLDNIHRQIALQEDLVRTEKNKLEISATLLGLQADLLELIEQKLSPQEKSVRIELATAEALKKTLQIGNKILQNEKKLVDLKNERAKAEVELANLSSASTRIRYGGISPTQELALKQKEQKGRLAVINREDTMKKAMAKVDYDILRLQMQLLKMQTMERLKTQQAEAVRLFQAGGYNQSELAAVHAADKALASAEERFTELLHPEVGQLIQQFRSSWKVIEGITENSKLKLNLDVGQAQVDWEKGILSIAQGGGESVYKNLQSLGDGFFTSVESRQKKAREDFAATTRYTPGSKLFEEGSDAAASGVAKGFDDIESTTTKVQILQGIMQSTMDGLRELGPEGVLAASVAEGSFMITQSFTTMFEEIGSGTEGMQKGAAIASAVASTIAATAQILAAASAARIAGIDAEIAAEQKRDGKSKASLAKIKSLEKKKEAMAKKAFNQNKKMQMASIIANTAAGVMGIIGKEAGTVGIGAIVLGAIVAAMGAAQLAIVAGTSYQGGGAGGGSAGIPASIAIGDRSNRVDLGRSTSGAGELAYLRGEKGRGSSASDFRPGAFAGRRYRAYGGSAYVVGEQGPELFMPEVPGQIVTNDNAAAMGAPVNVSFQISAIDSTNMEDMLTTQRGNIISMIREAANSHGAGFLEGVDISTYDATAGGNM